MNEKHHEDVIAAIKRKTKELLPEGSQVTLFGSRARGDFREDSDWDLHILIPGPERLSWDLISKYSYPIEELGFDMGEEINIIMYSFAGWEKRSFTILYKYIEEEGIRLL